MRPRPTRREAFGRVGETLVPTLAGLPEGRTQQTVADVRFAPRADLVNVLEYEDQARLALDAGTYAHVGGSDRSAFDRVTFRPRMMVPTQDLDLGLVLFGDQHATPILVGPVDGQQRFGADGVAGTLRGAVAARAAVVLPASAASEVDTLVAQADTPVWFQVFAGDSSAADSIARAVTAGCRAVSVTVGASVSGQGVRTAEIGNREWAAVGALAAATSVPVVVKGIADAAAARAAVDNGARGLVFSRYGGLLGGAESSVLDLPAVVEAADGVPVLADGSVRRGSDVLKALALGATAVLVARPVMWGLAAYGAEGVQGVLEMLQTELARAMAMCGKPSLGAIDRTVVRVHEARAGE